MKKMSEAFRRHKNDLRLKYYDCFITDEERMRNCPPKIAQDDWVEFVRNESKPDAKEKRNIGKKNRSMLEYAHHSGRKSHAMVTQELVCVSIVIYCLSTDILHFISFVYILVCRSNQVREQKYHVFKYGRKHIRKKMAAYQMRHLRSL